MTAIHPDVLFVISVLYYSDLILITGLQSEYAPFL